MPDGIRHTFWYEEAGQISFLEEEDWLADAQRYERLIAASSHLTRTMLFDVDAATKTVVLEKNNNPLGLYSWDYERGYKTQAVLRRLPLLRKQVEIEYAPRDIQKGDKLILSTPRGTTAISNSLTTIVTRPASAK